MEWLDTQGAVQDSGMFKRIQCRKIERWIRHLDRIIGDGSQPEMTRAVAMVARGQVDNRFGDVLRRAKVKLKPAPKMDLDMGEWGHDAEVVEAMGNVEKNGKGGGQ